MRGSWALQSYNINIDDTLPPIFLKFRHLDGIHDYPITHPTLKPELNRGSVFFWRSDYLPAYFWQHRTKKLQVPYQVNSLTHRVTKVWAYTQNVYCHNIFTEPHRDAMLTSGTFLRSLRADWSMSNCVYMHTSIWTTQQFLHLHHSRSRTHSWRRFLQSTAIASHPM